jgi:CubicO group peptidase (beta-lactamase class C family)
MPLSRPRPPALRLAALLLAPALLFAAAAVAAPPAPATPPPTAQPVAEPVGPDPAALAERARLAAFVEGVVQGFRQRDRIAGVVVGIVRDGEVVLLEGYGHARHDPLQAVDPRRDLFRIASISKTFTYAALMQQVERGRIGLDDPVNQHLPEPLRLPDDGRFAEPVRVHHLLHHTAGFEDLALGHLFVDEPAEVLTAAEYLVRHRPERVRAPGEQAVYSNYGIALLGALVAEVAGFPFETLIERELFQPLGMHDTSFREPGLAGDPREMDPALAARLATGFSRQRGAHVAMPLEHIAQVAAGGGASATAADMTRWMLALLGDGSLQGQRVLSPESNAAFRTVSFRNHEGVNGIAHGFITERIGPHFAYGHGGATLYFHSNMVLVPTLSLGVFISTNTATGRRFAREFPALLVEFLDPSARPALPAAAATVPDEALQAYAGRYLGDRRAWRSADALLVAQRSVVTEVAVADGQLLVSTPFEPLRFVPLGGHRFREAEGHGLLAFVPGPDGRIEGLAFGSGINTAERIGFFQHPRTPLLLVPLAGLLGLALLPALWAHAGRGRRPLAGADWAARVAGFAGLAWAGFAVLAACAWLQLDGLREQWMFVYPTPLWQWLLLLAPLPAALTAAQALLLPLAWRRRWPWWLLSLHGAMLVACGLAAWQLARWNLLGGFGFPL